MKAILVITMILALAIPVLAQEQTLLGSENTSSGFGGPLVKFSQIDGKFAVLAGGRGGWIINHSLILGGGGYGLVQDDIDRHVIGPNRSEFLTMGYGGFMMEYDFQPLRLMHTSLIMLIGGGELNRAVEGQNYRETIGNTKDDFFVVEPEINFTLNMTSFMRISTGASYRFVSDVEMPGLSNSDIAGPAASLMLRFGKF